MRLIVRTLRYGTVLVAIVGLAFAGLVAADHFIGSPGQPSAPTSPRQPVEVHPANASLLIHQQDAGGYDWYVKQLAGAGTSVQVWIYEIDDANVLDALVSAHARHVNVRVILDDAYAGRSINTSAYQRLHAAGVPVRWAPATRIFHIKASIIDGQVLDVLTGNFMPRYYATGMDVSALDTHADDVAAAQRAFDSDWSGRSPTKKTSGDSAWTASGGPIQLVWSPGARGAFVNAINGSRHRVQFASEVLTDEAIIAALMGAAGRGVSVEVLMTQGNLEAATQHELRSAGVRIVLTPDPEAHSKAAGAQVYVHQKSLLVDDQLAILGSQNASASSLNRNRELALRITDHSAIDRLRAGYESVWRRYESAG